MLQKALSSGPRTRLRRFLLLICAHEGDTQAAVPERLRYEKACLKSTLIRRMRGRKRGKRRKALIINVSSHRFRSGAMLSCLISTWCAGRIGRCRNRAWARPGPGRIRPDHARLLRRQRSLGWGWNVESKTVMAVMVCSGCLRQSPPSMPCEEDGDDCVQCSMVYL